MKILKDKYGMDEEDFFSAELEVVPAGPAREMGFDGSMVMSYGQDDRVCAYTSLEAILDSSVNERTSCCLLVDKEEIGSVGATGMLSRFFENMVAELINLNGNYSELILKRCLKNSKMLSSDVNAAYDPLYADVFSEQSTSYIGKGVVFNKFTGSRGKSGSNDANAEYLAEIRKVMDDNKVYFQMSELGKVDAGGGGTIAYIMSLYGMEVIDCGVPVLSMHAPWEVTSKADVYEAFKCYKAFLRMKYKEKRCHKHYAVHNAYAALSRYTDTPNRSACEQTPGRPFLCICATLVGTHKFVFDTWCLLLYNQD